jgi:hypothetical protein
MPIKDVQLPLVGEPTAAAKIVWGDATKTVMGRPPCWVMMSH